MCQRNAANGRRGKEERAARGRSGRGSENKGFLRKTYDWRLIARIVCVHADGSGWSRLDWFYCLRD
ncbi:hypothetical protein TIFTF001_030397 [Ficus carica]|uniref:Uncharacterized protein n=1 Tax=Ficus carica TaxID=3494 RepID=A0AA88DU14_FICCA|nr:hypothetical protein TIFTF001_030397 [Ficus carica]